MNFKPTPQQLTAEVDRQRSKTPAPPPRLDTYNIYVLRLKDGCYYIGMSKDVHWRVGRHVSGRGAAWTRLHPVIGHIDSVQCYTGDARKATEREDKVTLLYMQRHGWKKVRGGRFYEVDELRTEMNLRHHKEFERLHMFYAIAANNTKVGYRSNSKQKFRPDLTDDTRE